VQGDAILEQNISELSLRAILAATGNTDPNSETISLIALRMRTIAHKYHYEKVVRSAEIASAAEIAAHCFKIHKKTSELNKLLEDTDDARIPEIVARLNWLSNAAERSRREAQQVLGSGPVKHKQHQETSLYLALFDLYGEFTKQKTPGVANPFYQFTKICVECLGLDAKVPSLCDTFRKTVTEARKRRMKVEADKEKERIRKEKTKGQLKPVFSVE
jgi:hypothetical protein